MSFTENEAYVAKHELLEGESYGFVSAFTTVWKGNILMVNFNHVTLSIIGDPICSVTLDSGDLDFLENLLKNYFAAGNGLTG